MFIIKFNGILLLQGRHGEGRLHFLGFTQSVVWTTQNFDERIPKAFSLTRLARES